MTDLMDAIARQGKMERASILANDPRKALDGNLGFLNAIGAAGFPLKLMARIALGFGEAPGSVLLFPGDDPGSLGDEAILRGTVGQLSLRGANKIGIVRRRKEGIHLADYGPQVSEEPIWDGALSFIKVLGRYGLFVVLGADVLDGHYSELQSRELISYANIARAWGRGAAILGCSFNKTPAANVIRDMRALHHGVTLSMRDRRSLERFVATTGRQATLAADPAFLMEPNGPTKATGAIADWITKRRAAGAKVVGINVNPIPFLRAGNVRRERLLSSVAGLMNGMAMAGDYYFIVIPHDYRPEVGDLEITKALFERLPEFLRGRSRMVDERLSAAEAKDICGSLDAVISGRLHLCIAALGMAVPAFGMSYQDKFQGVLELFHGARLPMLEAADCADEARLRAAVFDFLASRDKLKQQIAKRLPAVTAMAVDNFLFLPEVV